MPPTDALPSDLVERFWSHVDKIGPIPTHRPDLGACWQWTASVDSSGYGAIQLRRRSQLRCWKAHRLSWEIARGPIPMGMYVCHHCDNPRCVNPPHLFLGTYEDNMRDMEAKGRGQWGGALVRGEDVGTAKLTEGDVRDIRAAMASGVSLTVLAQRYGVHKATVHRAGTHRSWRCLP